MKEKLYFGGTETEQFSSRPVKLKELDISDPFEMNTREYEYDENEANMYYANQCQQQTNRKIKQFKLQ